MGQKADETAPAARPRPSRARAVTALGVVGLSAAALLAGAWVVRIWAVDLLLHGALAQRGAQGDWRLTKVDLSGARLENVRIGPAERPDFQARAITASFAWGFGPRLDAITVEGGRLRARWTDKGLDLGHVGRLVSAGGPAKRRGLPDLTVEAPGLGADIDSPIGRISIGADASGRLGRDFRADARILTPTGAAADGRFAGLKGGLAIRTEAGGLTGRIDASLTGAAAGGLEIEDVALAATAKLDRALAAANGSVTLRAGRLNLGAARFAGWTASATANAADRGRGLQDGAWSLALTTALASYASPGVALTNLSAGFDAKGAEGAQGDGAWKIAAASAKLGGFDLPGEAKGAIALRRGAASGTGTVSLRGAHAVDPARLAAVLGVLKPTPAGPLATAAEPALRKALSNFDATIPLAFAFANGAGAVRGAGPAALTSASGATFKLTPAPSAPPWRIAFPNATIGIGGQLSLLGGGLPHIEVAKVAFESAGGQVSAIGRVAIDDWRNGAAALQTQDLELAWKANADGGRLTIAGDAKMTGPLAGAVLHDAVGPLDLDVNTKGRAWRVAPRSPCLNIRTAEIALVGSRFANATTEICAGPNGAFAAAAADGALGGGFRITPATLRGANRAELAYGDINARLSGALAAPVLDADIANLHFKTATGQDRTLAANVARLALQARAQSDWRVTGAFEGAAAADTGAPVRVSGGHGALTIEPAADGALIRIADASAVAIDETAPRPILNPLALSGVSAVIENGVVRAEGGVALEAGGAALGRFNAIHDFARAEGEANFTGADLTFSGALQPDQISVLARGIVENVEGPVDAAAHLSWSGDRLRMDGALTLKSVAAATAGLGPIEGVTGTITFDDLAALTTPPHQEVRIAKINPGVVVRDGIIRFKLEPEATIGLESASFPFAKGRLSVQPTLVKIGAAETRYRVELKDVDVAQLIRELDFKDLTATGRVEGVFPLIVTPLGARIEKGVLKSAPGGGEIAYVGDAGKAGAGGPSQVAFDALRSFRYDNLALELSGDLDGDIITGIVFNGVNNLPVSAATLVPGLRTTGATGLPFRFNVTVRAPFKTMAEGANRFTNPLNRLEGAVAPPPPPP